MWLTRLVQLKLQQCWRAVGQAGYQLRRGGLDPQFDPAVRAKSRSAHLRFGGIIRGQVCDAVNTFGGENQIKRRDFKRWSSRSLAGTFANLYPTLARYLVARPGYAVDIDNCLPVTGRRARHQSQQIRATASRHVAKAKLPGAGETMRLQQGMLSGHLQVAADPPAKKAAPCSLPGQDQTPVHHSATRPQAARHRAHLWRHPRHPCHSGGGYGQHRRRPKKQECHQ